MDGKRAALAVRVIGRCVMQGLAMMKHNTTGGQLDNFGSGYLHLIFDIKQRIGLRRTLMGKWPKMRAGDNVHSPVLDIGIVQGKPA